MDVGLHPQYQDESCNDPRQARELWIHVFSNIDHWHTPNKSKL